MYLLVALALLKSIVLHKVFSSVPAMELKRLARAGNRRAQALYKISAYQRSLDVLVWLTGTVSVVILAVWSARTSWWLAAIVIGVTAWLLAWVRFSAWGWAGGLTAFAAPYSAAILSFLDPVLRPLAAFFPAGGSFHTGLYEKKDLLELFGAQSRQHDNRVSPNDLKIAYNALNFGDKTVGKVMTPRKAVRFVKADEPIGPILVDELHKTGVSCFPVVKEISRSAAPQIIGTLYLNRLIGYEGSGKVKDLANDEINYINEDDTLDQALNAFLKAHHHLLVVVNTFEEMVGVLTLEDVLEQLLGKRIVDEIDSYKNLREVAAAKEEPTPTEAESTAKPA